jgi:hypothetical protein
MQIAEYYTIRRAVQDNAPSPDEAATAALETELRAALLATGLFHTVEVGRTKDADRLVIAMCGFAPDVDETEVSRTLAQVWSKQVAYGFWQAQTMRVDKGHIELQGATRLSLRGHFATTHVVAHSSPVPVAVAVRPAMVRQTPSTGFMQQQPVAAPAVRRSRRWLTGRPVAA